MKGLSAAGRAALDYTRRGWPVFPILPRDKKPAINGGFTNAMTDSDEVAEWWGERPSDNVGIALGQVCGGIIVIDLDIKPDAGIDGAAVLEAWERENGMLPETVSAKTGSGGTHLLYRTVEEVRNKVGKEEWRGVDVRGDGGYIVAPPSVHPSGGVYEWVNPPWEYDVADADETVHAFLGAIKTEVNGSSGARRHDMVYRQGLPPLPKNTCNEGGRNDFLYAYACGLWGSGYSAADVSAATIEANEACCIPPLDQREVGAIINSALSKHGGIPYAEYKGRSDPNNTLAKQEDEAKTEKLDKFTSGVVKPTLMNAIRIIENVDCALKGRFAYSRFDQHIMVSLPLPWDCGSGTRWLADEDILHLTAYAEDAHGYGFKGKLEDAVRIVADRHAYDPLVNWLESLEWDGEPRILTALTRYLGCEATDYPYHVLRTWMCGAVRRAYEPGAKVDIMPILVGAQGIGKSRFSSLMCPREEWFASGFSAINNDNAGMSLRGKWVIEMAELTAMKNAKNVETLKAFITTDSDHFRAPYAHEFVNQPRRCVFIGTTNDPTFLSDKTGNRRFPPLKCGVMEPMDSLWSDGIQEEFAQMWAEAVHIYKSGDAPTHLSPTAEAMMEARQEEFVDEDPRTGQIQEYLDGKKLRSDGVPKSLEDLKRLGLAVCTMELAIDALKMEHDRVIGNKSLFIDLNKIMQHEVRGWVRMGGMTRLEGYGKQRAYVPEEYAGMAGA